MRLKDWCVNKGISYATRLRWFHSGKIKNAYQMDTDTIIIDEPINNAVSDGNNSVKHAVIYARVSNRDRKEQLNYQVDRLTNFAISNGFIVDKSYKEIASGMNDERKIFWQMINSNPPTIIVENKDRLTRFGFNYLKVLLKKINIEIIVVNNTDDDKQDLIMDFVSIITSFCCRLYSLRRCKVKSQKIIEVINDTND